MSWAAPERLALLMLAPMVLLCGWLWWRRMNKALSAWAGRAQWPRLGIDASRVRLWTRLVLISLAVAASVLAIARPRWGESERTVERVGVDTVVILDSSTSMLVADVTPSRMAVAKTLLGRLTEHIEGHRVALLQMEGTVRALTPMTADLEAVRLAIESVQVGSLERPGTDLGLALERGADLFLPGEERHRGILLITDGEDHGDNLKTAERRLAEAGISVHVLAVGTDQGGPIPVAGAGRGVYKKDGQGQVVISKLGVDSLTNLSEITGGQFVVVDRAGASIEPVVDAILGLEARSLGQETITQKEERFQLPLLVSILALASAALIKPLRPVKEAM